MPERATAEENERDWHVKPDEYGTDYSPVIEVLEHMNGHLFFVTDRDYGPEGVALGFQRLYDTPEHAEWGSIAYDELTAMTEVWPVPRENWRLINTYEDGLLVQEDNQ